MRDATGDGWLVSVDPTVPRAHQHAVGARKKGQGLHLSCDGRGRPLGFVLTGGNAAD
ncbi:hypothetical protein AB0953_05170 [Streptomyces sp. NPDC046866]|uniref:hypothetical protein n=1 Tax=Streptomyces sp. NPDC046866 TaxID=3154921 RepID=UPI003456D236